MAIGVDNRLKASNLFLPSPLAQKPAAPQKTPQYSQMAPTVNQGAVDDVNNNLLAGVAGAGRMAQQQMGGRGISAGRGQRSRADMADQMAMVKAQQQAQQNNMDASARNQASRFAYDTAMQGEQIQNRGLLNSLFDAQGQARNAQNSFGQGLAETIAQGKLGLNRIQLDKTPVLQSLLQGLF